MNRKQKQGDVYTYISNLTHREKRLKDIQIMRRYRKGKCTDRKTRIMDKIGIERTLDRKNTKR